MFDLFISSAYAASPEAVEAVSQSQDILMKFAPMFVIFGIFYFILLRPQQKKMEAQENMLAALKVGDKILTGGGLVAVITKIEGENFVIAEIAKDVRVMIARPTITGLVDEKQLVANDTAK